MELYEGGLFMNHFESSILGEDYILFVVAAVLLLIATVLFLVPYIIRKKKEERCCCFVNAKVIANSFRQQIFLDNPSRSRSLYVPVYEYSYGGKQYKQAAAVATNISYRIGTEVEISINPDEPCEIFSPHDSKLYTRISLCGLFPVLFGIGVLILGISTLQ